MTDKTAVVTGSNKGIGFAIVRELLRRNVKTVYLTSRDIARGKEAVKELEREGLKPEFYQLEVTDRDNVKEFANYLKKKHGGVDILINNAGVIVNDFYKTTYEDAKYVIDVNYRSIIVIEEYLFPILKDNARVINVSSDCGHLSNIRNKYWIDRLSQKDIKCEDVDAFVDWFLESVKKNELKEEDFAETAILAYRISKVALCALTIVQQNSMKDSRNISVVSVHPGFVQTSMTKNFGLLTLDESGKTPAYLALDAPQSLKGAYIWYDKRVLDWHDVKADYYCHFENFGKMLKDSGYL